MVSGLLTLLHDGAAWWAYISSGLTADGGQHIITLMNMEEGLWVYMGGLPKMITTLPPPVAPRGAVRSHLKVEAATEALRYGGRGTEEFLPPPSSDIWEC